MEMMVRTIMLITKIIIIVISIYIYIYIYI